MDAKDNATVPDPLGNGIVIGATAAFHARCLETPYSLHPAPHTPHPAPFTLHPTPYTPSGFASRGLARHLGPFKPLSKGNPTPEACFGIPTCCLGSPAERFESSRVVWDVQRVTWASTVVIWESQSVTWQTRGVISESLSDNDASRAAFRSEATPHPRTVSYGGNPSNKS